MQFAPVGHLYRWYELNYIMNHLIPPMFPFHTSTHSIMFILSRPHFKKIQICWTFVSLWSWLNQKRTCWLELPYTPIWPNPMLCEWYVILLELFINQAKKMLNKQCVMFTIITNVEMVLLNHIVWLESAILTINIHLYMFVWDMYEYRDLVWMIVLTLYLCLGIKCVNLGKVYH